MRISLDINKTVDQNAQVYFELAKKSRKKGKGAAEAVQKAKDNLIKVKEEKPVAKEKKEKRKKVWYEKFRWFVSSDGFLVIAGRDATTNEIVVKKHTDKDDFVFHTEMAGSPFVVIKFDSHDGEIPNSTKEEAAMFCVGMSRAFKQGYANAECYMIKPDQVSKKAAAGEYMGRGSFMIYGERKYFNPEVKLGVCIHEEKIMCAPLAAVKKHKEFLEIMQGNDKASDVAKTIRAKLGYDDLDDIIAVLPPGKCAIKKKR